MKKTILSFLLIGSATAIMAQQPTSTNPNTNRNQNPSSTLNQNQNPNQNQSTNTNPNNNSNLNNNNSINNPVNNQQLNTPTNTSTPPTNISSSATDSAYPEQPSQQMNTSAMGNNSMIEANTNTYNVAVPSSIQTTFTTSYPGVTGTWQRSGDWYQARYVENGMIKQVMYREDGKVLTSSISPIKQSFVPDEMVTQAIQRYGATLYSIGTSRGANGQDLYRVTLIENGQSKTEWMNADGSTADDHFRTAEEPAATGTINSKHDQVNSGTTTDSSQQQMNATPTDSSQHLMNNDNNHQQQPAEPSLNESSNQHENSTNSGTQEQGINNANGTSVPQRRK